MLGSITIGAVFTWSPWRDHSSTESSSVNVRVHRLGKELVVPRTVWSAGISRGRPLISVSWRRRCTWSLNCNGLAVTGGISSPHST